MRLLLAAFPLLLLVSSPALGQPLRHVRIDAPDAPNVAGRLLLDGYDVLENSIGPGSFEVIASIQELAALEGLGHRFQLLAEGRPFGQIQLERQAAAQAAVPSGYPDLTAVLAQMQAVADAFPGIAQVVDLTTAYGTPTTFEGRSLFALKISDNVTVDEDEPAYLLVSAHHAREIVTPVIALHAIEQLTSLYGIDPEITARVDELEIWIAPVWNPDGYEHVFDVDNLWRKNRRVFPTGTGVDQNRNYTLGWTSPCDGSTSVGSSTYRGPSPASEAETQTMLAWSADRHFAKVGDFHSSGREVRYGLACLTYPFLSFLMAEASDLSVASGYGGVIGPSCCSGGHFGFQIAFHASYAFLWETATTFQPSFASAEAEAALVFPGILEALARPIPLSGHVSDAITGVPVQASLAIAGVTFVNGEVIESEKRFGRYHAFLPAGSYSIEYTAVGYLPQTLLVDVPAGGAEVVDVALTPEWTLVPASSPWSATASVALLLILGGVLAARGGASRVD